VNCEARDAEFGVVHITAGTGGVELDTAGDLAEEYSHKKTHGLHGYLRVSSIGSYALTIEFVAVQEQGRVVADSVSIVREWGVQEW
jgi:hypothetical protein